MQNNHNVFYGFLFIIIVVFAVIGTTIYENRGKQNITKEAQVVSSPKTTNNPPPAVTQSKSVYKDGTYSVDGTYITHVGPETIGVNITIKHDTITDSSVTIKGSDEESQQYQDIFASNYKAFVIGKNIASVQLDKVSTSSLTPIGFNDALKKIEAQAKS